MHKVKIESRNNSHGSRDMLARTDPARFASRRVSFRESGIRLVDAAPGVAFGAIAMALVIAAAPLRTFAQQPSRTDTIAAGLPLTLDDALREARSANAQLPIANLGITLAQTQVREARASRFPTLSLESGANLGGPLSYTTPQGQLQLVGNHTIYSGGLRRAQIRAAEFRTEVATAGYRIAEKDVDLNVRLRFAEVLRAQDEVTLREQGIARLRSYLAQIQERRAAGQPVGSDVVTTQVRLGTEEALLADAVRLADEARLQLNDLMGRDPDRPLTVVPLPPPAPPSAMQTQAPWLATPEMRQAAANRSAAEAGIAAARAERRPQLSAIGSLGVLPVFSDSNPGTGLNSGTGYGGMVVFSLSWPFWDAGGYRARLERAQLQAQQASDSQVVMLRQTRLAWELANTQRNRLYAQVQLWERTAPLARDAYLQTASLYAGGVATALEVLDAYSAWITASVSYADAILSYRQAEANALRWGTS